MSNERPKWRVVFRPGYFEEPQVVEDGFTLGSDAWVRAAEVIVEDPGSDVGVQQYLPKVGRIAWSRS